MGIYDLIYGMGIANYFYDETLVKILSRAFSLLTFKAPHFVVRG